MKDIKNIIISVLILIILTLVGFIFISSQKQEISEKQAAEILESQIKIERNYFSSGWTLPDYSWVDFVLEPEAKEIILSMRNLHKAKTLIAAGHRDKELCAWYVWELSKQLWWELSPYYIGMQNKKTQTPAKAWELPSYYEYVGGKILIDYTGSFDLASKNLYEVQDISSLKKFFLLAFSQEALLGDIGFLYADTNYVDVLRPWNHNSHIWKNMWVSSFELSVTEDNQKLESILSCDSETFWKISGVLENYKILVNNMPVIYYSWELYYLRENNILWEKIILKFGDVLKYDDITFAHFFDWVTRVDSLFQLTCSWDFLPINIMQINPKLIEKI